MPTLSVTSTSVTPVYQQIVEQIRYLIEAGHTKTGEKLPSARLLAKNLEVNRNTVARAYAALRDMGYIETRGAGGTVVTGEGRSDLGANQREEVRALLMGPVRAAVELGLAPDDIGHLALNLALQVGSQQLTVVFVECNQERAAAFASELSDRLQVNVTPSLITDLDTSAVDCDLLVTTFFHLAEVRRWVTGVDKVIETAAIVVSPHIQTLMEITNLADGARVGVRYPTEHQTEQVRDWVAEAATSNIEIISFLTDKIPPDLDVLVVPAEHPEFSIGTFKSTRIIEFGGVLDEGSIRSLDEVLSEIRQRSI